MSRNWRYSSHAKKHKGRRKWRKCTSNTSSLTTDYPTASSQTETLVLRPNGSLTYVPSWKSQRTLARRTTLKLMGNQNEQIKPWKPSFESIATIDRMIGRNTYL